MPAKRSPTSSTCRSSAIPHDVLVPRVWELRENFSAYDATYVALAEALADEPVPVLTADARLARATGDHGDVPVVLVD